jgi:site-specific recombinase XerD
LPPVKSWKAGGCQMPTHKTKTLAEQYEQSLHYGRVKHLPAGTPRPLPPACWPQGNLEFLERYRAWLLGGGVSELVTKLYHVPMAGHVFGLTLKHHSQLDLDYDLDCALEYVRAKGVGDSWLKNCRLSLVKFRRFLRLERGLGEESKITSFDVAAHSQGLPVWVVTELERYQRIQQRNWRPARIDLNLRGFWSKHGQIWRFLCQERGVQQLADLKRPHILDYIDFRLRENCSAATVNTEARMLHSFLLFLQEEGYTVPQALLRIPSLKQPDSMPKYLTDEQVRKLRDELERGVQAAALSSHRRLALLVRAAFYLLWQGGMRLGEVEELRLEDLDISTYPAGTMSLNAGLSHQRLSVRNGKGLKDRTIYLTETAVLALQDYLAARGEGGTDHVFLYRNAPLKKDIIRAQLQYAGQRAGVKVYPHRLRHTCATQLLNAGCRVTSIQAFLGHKKLNTTMIYARAHDQNVAEDYFAAMQRVEQRLDTSAALSAGIVPVPQEKPQMENEVVNVQPVLAQPGPPDQVLFWLERLALPELCQQERLEIAEHLKQTLCLGFACQLSPPVKVPRRGMAMAG